MSKRYVRRGPPGVIPQIYCGDLRGLAAGVKDTKTFSANISGKHTFGVHEPATGIIPLKIFENGTQIWHAEDNLP